MTEVSQNGWPVILDETDDRLYRWQVPTREGIVPLLLHRGPAGFVLTHFASWFADSVESIFGRGDDFGWDPRQIAGSSEWSNHASGTAEDLNSSWHPQGKLTFTDAQVTQIRGKLAETYLDAIRWGGDYRTTVDQMHFEINQTPDEIRSLAQMLDSTARGRRILRLNPTQKGRLL